jgi:thiol-disulfide isomerase/thioredoxin
MKRIFLSILVLVLSFTFLSASAMPDFSLKAMDGTVYKSGEHVGKKVIVIDFWAMWCKPCKKLISKLNDIYKERKDKIEVLAVCIDDSSAISQAESYIKGKGYEFKVLFDSDSQLLKRINPKGNIPFTVILNKKGEIAYQHMGYLPGAEKELAEKIDGLINE